MLKDILPIEIYNALYLKNNDSEINEIRIRVEKPIVVFCNTRSYYLSENGLCSNLNQAIFADKSLIEDIVFRASEYSIYSVNEQMKQGFINYKNGIRIGLCGDVVIDDKVKTIKNFNSLCIRLPHMVRNCSLPIFNQILNNGNINNTLIISPPGAGKTTMLRDLIYQFSYHNYPYNIFIADEKGEISSFNINKGLGNFYDSICYLNKKDSIILGIRNMNPDIIFTDEIGYEKDFEALEYALNCGVKVVATMHANDIEDLKNKPGFERLLALKYFKRIIVLTKENGIGTIEGVYKENLIKIYGGISWNY